MGLLLEIVLGYSALCTVGLVTAVGMCRSGHLEDVRNGFVSEGEREPVITAEAPR